MRALRGLLAQRDCARQARRSVGAWCGLWGACVPCPRRAACAAAALRYGSLRQAPRSRAPAVACAPAPAAIAPCPANSPAVVPAGTWATHTVAAADHLAVVAAPSADNEMSAVMMAAGAGAPALATALLQFASLSDGDVVVQTAAHSAVGQVVTQMAAERGVAVINIVPDHTEFEDIAQHLSALNPAGFTVRENTARSPQFAKLLSDLPAASLVIDGAGGAAAISAAGALRAGGTLVSYANASRKPIVMPMAQILERGIVVRGFNLDGWAREVSVEERSNLAKTCAEASAAGKYSQLLKTENFGDWTHALAAATDATSTRRVVMVMQ